MRRGSTDAGEDVDEDVALVKEAVALVFWGDSSGASEDVSGVEGLEIERKGERGKGQEAVVSTVGFRLGFFGGTHSV